MTRAFTLLLTGALAIAAPARSLAQDMLVSTNLTGQLRIQIDGPLDHVDRTTPLTKGRLEFQMGPLAGGKRPFMLTRASMQFADVTIDTRSLNGRPLPLVKIAAHGRDALMWYAEELLPGVYKIFISPDAVIVDGKSVFPQGDPVFLTSSQVDDSYYVNNPDPVIKLDDQTLLMRERIDEPITGVIDLNAKTIELTTVFRDKKEVVPTVTVERTFTVTLLGTIGPKGSGPGASGGGGTGGSPDGPGKGGPIALPTTKTQR
jgi:hypothetical protein